MFSKTALPITIPALLGLVKLSQFKLKSVALSFAVKIKLGFFNEKLSEGRF